MSGKGHHIHIPKGRQDRDHTRGLCGIQKNSSTGFFSLLCDHCGVIYRACHIGRMGNDYHTGMKTCQRFPVNIHIQTPAFVGIQLIVAYHPAFL